MRALEYAWIRLVIDPSFVPGPDLTPEECALLEATRGPALDVERRGRWAHLWLRAKHQMPHTTTQLAARYARAELRDIQRALYATYLWRFDRTVDLPRVGKGFELATPLRDCLVDRVCDDRSQLVAELAQVEWFRFVAAHIPLPDREHRLELSFDLLAACANPKTLAADLRVATATWVVTSSATLTPEPVMPVQSLVFAPTATLELQSFRLNNHVAANLHYLAMGRTAQPLAKAYSELCKAARAGSPTWFEDHGAPWFRRDGEELTLAEAYYYEPTIDLFEDDLRLVFGRTDDDRQLVIRLNRASMALFSSLIPMLQPDVSLDTLQDRVDDGVWRLLEQLEEAGFLARVPQQAPPPRSTGVTFLGHAGLALHTESTRVLIDPLLCIRHRRDVPGLHHLHPRPDAIVFSHPHWDHFNLDTLLHIERDTPIYIPRLQARASIENVDMGAVLDQLGFTDIRPLRPWQSTPIGDITLTAVPFHGETAGPDSIRDWMTYHVEIDGQTLFGAVDTFDMDDILRRLRLEKGPVDMLFAPYTSFAYPTSMFTRRPFYMGPGMESFTASPDDAVRWSTMLGARVLVPYAGFNFLPEDIDRSPDPNQRGRLQDLFRRCKSRPAGPLQIMHGGQTLTWDDDGALHIDEPAEAIAQ